MKRGCLLRPLLRFLLLSIFINAMVLMVPARHMSDIEQARHELVTSEEPMQNDSSTRILSLYISSVLISSALVSLAFYILAVRPGRIKSGGSMRTAPPGPGQPDSKPGQGGARDAGEISSLGTEATIGEIASSIAHEIKNPLAGISGAIQVLEEEFPEDDGRGEIVRQVLSEIERLDTSIKDLLSYARPARPDLMVIPAMELVESAVKQFTIRAKNTGIDVNISRADDSAMLNADPEQLRQALCKIMAFSVRTMPSGGTITFDVTSLPDKGYVEITLSDTGEGLDEDVIKNLFSPFRTSRVSGVGLSMAISRTIITNHGGEIEVENSLGPERMTTPDKGKTLSRKPDTGGKVFRITLPLYIENA